MKGNQETKELEMHRKKEEKAYREFSLYQALKEFLSNYGITIIDKSHKRNVYDDLNGKAELRLKEEENPYKLSEETVSCYINDEETVTLKCVINKSTNSVFAKLKRGNVTVGCHINDGRIGEYEIIITKPTPESDSFIIPYNFGKTMRLTLRHGYEVLEIAMAIEDKFQKAKTLYDEEEVSIFNGGYTVRIVRHMLSTKLEVFETLPREKEPRMFTRDYSNAEFDSAFFDRLLEELSNRAPLLNDPYFKEIIVSLFFPIIRQKFEETVQYQNSRIEYELRELESKKAVVTAKRNGLQGKCYEEIAKCDAEIAGYDEVIGKLQEFQNQISEKKQSEESEEKPKEAIKKVQV